MTSAVKTSADSWDKSAAGYSVPEESDEKIQYAFRMILEAHRGRSMTADNEIRSLRNTLEELKTANQSLTKKLAVAEREIMEQQHRNQVLSKDNDNLGIANRQLMQRVEKYKRIQQTFSEALENSGHEEDLTPMPMMNSGEYRSTFTTSLPTPTAMSAMSSAVAAVPASTAPPAQMSPKTNERTASNGSNNFDSNGKDGKQFFRVVRTRLPFESFNAFLTIIKKLNAHEFTREVAVEEAKKIFGAENQDLLGDFQTLISRHIN